MTGATAARSDSRSAAAIAWSWFKVTIQEESAEIGADEAGSEGLLIRLAARYRFAPGQRDILRSGGHGSHPIVEGEGWR